ncbi:FAD dependent oxidoreductase [Thermocrinis albus DSM 14484]|uniref:FAD dependent oxidoreductase n=1 Tax=Thermocrinis albus (strain DSM 14484 / JCM 11386 / HI 11/12) TaxID=638303 RepID=D3SP29_THEAH|nr:FAD-dependent oxidoreductase [Thermocrinis albus]ADC88916.1 FAD dependent oxidoreductase [Thermocrinis albus DSM 14484]
MKVLIVGGGILGLSSGLLLSLEGLRVSVVTRNPQEATSWVAGGMLAPFSEGLEGDLLEFSYRSLREYPQFLHLVEDVSGQKVYAQMDGIFRVVLEDEDHLIVKAQEYASRGYRTYVMEPHGELSKKVKALILYQEEGCVDAENLMDALLLSTYRTGIPIQVDEITRVELQDGEVKKVDGIKGSYEADFYVFCTGVWTKELFPLPIFPVKGQAIKVKEVSVERVHYSRLSYIIPRNRYLYIGATSEVGVLDHGNTLEGLHQLTEGAISILPALAKAKLLSTLYGYRPATPDEKPVFLWGKNFLLATGHHRNGILQAPITAQIVRNYITRGEVDPFMKVFDGNRFEVK